MRRSHVPWKDFFNSPLTGGLVFRSRGAATGGPGQAFAPVRLRTPHASKGSCRDRPLCLSKGPRACPKPYFSFHASSYFARCSSGSGEAKYEIPMKSAVFTSRPKKPGAGALPTLMGGGPEAKKV